VNQEWDYLSTKPPYGVTGWTKDGRGVILTHRYDLWFVPFDGGRARNLTAGVGSEHEIRLRYVRLDPDEQFIDLSQPVLLSAYGEWTKQAGFYELRNGRMRELVLSDNIFSTPQKARDADRLLFTRQSWSEFPDLHVASDRSRSRAGSRTRTRSRRSTRGVVASCSTTRTATACGCRARSRSRTRGSPASGCR
jgi:hypothetical protein